MSRNRRVVFVLFAATAVCFGLAALAWGNVYLGTFAGVKGPSTGFTNADLNGTYRFRNLEFEDFTAPDEQVLIGLGSVTFNGAGTWTGTAQNLQSDGSVDTEAIGGTYAMDPSGSFSFSITGAPGHTWNGHLSKDAGRNFMVLTLGGDLGSFVLQSLVVAVKERGATPALSTFTGTFAYSSLGVADFESQDPDALATIAQITSDGAGNWAASYTSYNGDGQAEEGTVTGTYTVNGKSFDLAVTGETGVFMTADLSSDGNTLVLSSSSDSLSDGEQFIGTMVKRNPAATFSNASLNGGYKIGMMMIRNFGRSSAGTTVVNESVTFDGTGGFTSSYSAVPESGTAFTGTRSGIYAVGADGSVTLIVTSETPVQNYTGALSQDSQVITGIRVDGAFSAPGELFLDMGAAGLYAFDGYDLRQVSTLNAGAMAGIDGGIAIGFTGYGLYAYDGNDWEALTAAMPDDMAFWSGSLVADFGIYGLWVLNDTSWTPWTAADAQGMAVWGNNIAVFFPGFGLYSYDGSAWTPLTAASVEQLVGWGTQLVVDFGDTWGVQVYNGTTWIQLDPLSPEDMIAWGNNLVMDYSNVGKGVWSYNGSTWTALAVGDPESMLGWGNYLVLDYGASGVFLYDLTTWTQITTMNPEDMAIAEFN